MCFFFPSGCDPPILLQNGSKVETHDEDKIVPSTNTTSKDLLNRNTLLISIFVIALICAIGLKIFLKRKQKDNSNNV